MKQRAFRSGMQGMSLVELLISLVIGMVVVGAVLVSYLASGKTSAQQAAYAEMNENAQIGMTIISRDLLLAGYARPTILNPAGTAFMRTHTERSVFGCDNGFASPNTVGVAACAVGAGQPALEVAYEADLTNTVPTGANVPSDCLGNGLADAGGYFVAFNRYYLAASAAGRSELHCASRQGSAGQPLVDNVDNMKVWYGEANVANPRAIVRYVPAGNVADWGRVVSVRVCLLLRSTEPLLQSGGNEDTLTYLDCDSVQQASADRFLRRAYFTTTTLRNKMAL